LNINVLQKFERVKLLLLLTFFFLCTSVSATDYYISASGNDTNTGLSTSISWKTIAKVNSAFANMKPGDQILFNRGDTFYGSLVISKSGASGSPITIGAFGSGNNPIFSGLVTLTSWTDNGNGIFYSTLDVPRLNIVTLNGIIKEMGRFPNTGFLNYESHNANLSITDNQLTGTPNWTGAEIGIRKYRWIIDRHTVTNHTNNTLTYSSNTNYGNATFYNPVDGNGYFLQNHIGCLEDLGDWCYNVAEKRIYMHFGGGIPSNYVIKAGNVQTGIAINSKSYIDFINIDFEGANIDGISIIGSNHINATNCNLINQGSNGLYGINSDYITIIGGSINNALNNGIFFEWNVNDVTIDGLTLTNAGNILGASKSGDATATGIYIAGNDLAVKNCNVSNIGYNAISFNGDNALVENNIVSNFCTLKDDGGGIYTYNGTGAVIRNNIILNAIGAYVGSESAYWEPFGKCAGIYLDNGVSNHNATVSGNTVANGDFTGIFINNNGGNSLLNNTVYNFKQYQLLIYGYTAGNIRNTTISGNQFISKTSTQKVLYNQLFLNENPSLFGTINNNYYACPIDDNLTIQTSINGNTIINRTLAQWQSYSGQDASSHKSPIAINDTSSISFYYNETKINKTIVLAVPMVDIKGVKYYNSFESLPFTSAVLMVDPNPELPVLPIFNSFAIENVAPSLIEITYNLSLANIVPATSAFSVLVNSAARAVNAVAISGTKVQLTLANPIAFGDVVTVAYTKPAVSPLQTTSAGLATSVTAQAVTNNISAPVPVCVSAAVGNTAPSLVEITYNLSLANIVPATSAFTVLVNSAARTVSAVAISGTKVQLTLAGAIAYGDVVTLAYTKPAVSPLQTTSAGLAASVTAQAVTNNISAPVPVYVSAAVGNTAPSLIEMTYNLSLANILPATSAFTVLVNFAARTVSAVTISGTNVQLTLASTIAFGDVVTVAYTKPAVSPLQTTSAGLAASVTAQTVTNSTNPKGINGSHFVPVWQGENGTNHMNLIVVSATLENLPLSVDDEIAVFSGSKCVGSMILTKSINAAINSTFLAIPASQDDGSNNGFISNDSIIFKIWDHTNQREMGTNVVNYKNDIPTWLTSGKYSAGATSVVEIATFTENIQTIALLQGYNLISTYKSPDDPNVSTVAKQLMDQGELIKVQDEAGNSFENWGSFGGWINKIGSFESTEGYKIKVANNCTLRVTGRPIVLPLDIPLQSGWNIISFPRTDLVDAMDIIQSLIDQNKLIKVQDEAGNSIENWGIFGGWKNAIGNFIPGKAYKVKSNADAVITIHENYLKSATIPFTAAKAEYFLTKIEGNGTDHMNINIVGLQEAGLSIGDELAAFDGDVCVGSLKITKNNMIDGTAGLVASALTDAQKPDGFKEGSIIRIVAWNKSTNKEFQVQTELLNGQLNYQKEASVLVRMKALTPDAKIIDDRIKTEVYPNPCNGNFTVRLSAIPETGGRIEILDISGRNILSRGILETAEEFNLDHQQPGIYIVKTKIGSTQTNHKLIIY